MRLVKTSASPGRAPALVLIAIRMDGACHGIAELHFIVANAVSAQQRAIGFVDLLRPALEDFRQLIQIAFGRPSQDGKRRDGFTSHGVDVAQRVGRGDGAECVRVIHDRRKEIDGLHQGNSGVSLYTPASSAVSNPTSTFSFAQRGIRASTWSKTFGLSLDAQPAAED